jgi:hypothetical protein
LRAAIDEPPDQLQVAQEQFHDKPAGPAIDLAGRQKAGLEPRAARPEGLLVPGTDTGRDQDHLVVVVRGNIEKHVGIPKSAQLFPFGRLRVSCE